jgi:hypothetical protein
MGAPQYEQAGADIGGTGTTNTIPRWTGPSTLGDSGLIDNGTAIYTTTRNVGIGTASPGAILHTLGTGTTTGIFATTSANAWVELRRSTSTTLGYIGTGAGLVTGGAAADLAFRCESGNLLFSTGATERARIDSSGNVGIGTASPSSYDAGARNLVVGSGTGNQGITIAGNGNLNLYFATGTTGGDPYRGYIRYTAAGDAFTFATASTVRASLGGSSLDISATSGYGLKLPATPNNGNANTLDSYQEGTRVLAAGDLSGWTYVTATQYWTLVGRTVTLHTVFTGGTSSATGGATIATPPLLTPLRIAAGAAVNSSGTALGNGVCVVTSTSSTTGTVITSSAISSSAIDKVLTVTYETAGL